MAINDPVPSTAFDVLQRNVQDVDRYLNTSTVFNNRVGIPIKPIPMQATEWQTAIGSVGWFPVGNDFSTGATLTARNQVIYDPASTAWYSWGGALPKTVPAASSPSSTGGISAGAWTMRSDAALATALNNGTALINGLPASVLESVLFVFGIKGLKELNGAVQTTTGFYSGSSLGSSRYYYAESRTREDHNGVTVIAAPALVSWDGSAANLGDLFSWSGSGSGCFVMIDQLSNPEQAGAVRNDRTVDNSAALKKFHELTKFAEYPPGQEFAVSKCNVIKIQDGSTINFNDCAIYVDAATVPQDTTGSFGRFSNWIFYRDNAGPLNSDIYIGRPRVLMLCNKINAFGAADTRAVRDQHTAQITIDHPTFIGVGEPSGLGGPTTTNNPKNGALWYGNGYILNAAAPDVTLAGQPIIAMGSKRVAVVGGTLDRSAVSEDLTTWANGAALLLRGSEFQYVSGVNINITGGSSVFLSQDQEDLVKSVYVDSVTVTGAGLSAISAGHRTYANTPADIEYIHINAQVFGWCCAIGASEHSGVKVALESTTAPGRIKNLQIIGTYDFCAPFEVFDRAAGEFTVTYNNNKKTGFDIGTQAAVQATSVAGSAINSGEARAYVKNHARLGVQFTGFDDLCLGVQATACGWAKKSNGDPWQIQQSARVSTCDRVRGSVYVADQSLGVVRSDSFCTPVYLSDVRACAISIETEDDNNQKYAVRLVQNIEGAKYDLNIKSGAFVSDAGYTNFINTSSGAFSTNSNLAIYPQSVNIVTGSRTVPPSAGVIKKSVSDIANRTATLLRAKMYTGQAIEFVGGAAGNLVVSPFAGETINGSADPLTIAPGARASLYSNGNGWETI